MYGADEDGELYKGIMSFMIVGLKSSVPYVVKTLPEKKITGDWVKESLLSYLKMLQENGFNVRGYNDRFFQFIVLNLVELIKCGSRMHGLHRYRACNEDFTNFSGLVAEN